jgi:serine/threonine protein kinase
MPDHNQPTAGPPGREQQDAVTAPIGASPVPGAAGPGDARGQAIGPYTLLEVIGEGGFGTVWLAERREPMVQRVALKIIKPGHGLKVGDRPL